MARELGVAAKFGASLGCYLHTATTARYRPVVVAYYSEVPNRRADRNKRAGLGKKCHPACLLLSELINEQSGIFRLLHEKLRAGWKENLKNLSEHALLLGTSE